VSLKSLAGLDIVSRTSDGEQAVLDVHSVNSGIYILEVRNKREHSPKH